LPWARRIARRTDLHIGQHVSGSTSRDGNAPGEQYRVALVPSSVRRQDDLVTKRRPTACSAHQCGCPLVKTQSVFLRHAISAKRAANSPHSGCGTGKPPRYVVSRPPAGSALYAACTRHAERAGAGGVPPRIREFAHGIRDVTKRAGSKRSDVTGLSLCYPYCWFEAGGLR